MSNGVKTLVTLLALACVLLVAALWGFSALTKPFPGKADAPICVNQTISKGDKLFPSDVVVSVDNAGDRNGLAGRTLGLLQGVGFVAGDTGNAPKNADVPYAEIWTTDPKSPVVDLLKSWLGPRTKVVDHKSSSAGVLVVVGDGFDQLAKGRHNIVASSSATVCSPPLS